MWLGKKQKPARKSDDLMWLCFDCATKSPTKLRNCQSVFRSDTVSHLAVLFDAFVRRRFGDSGAGRGEEEGGEEVGGREEEVGEGEEEEPAAAANLAGESSSGTEEDELDDDEVENEEGEEASGNDGQLGQSADEEEDDDHLEGEEEEETDGEGVGEEEGEEEDGEGDDGAEDGGADSGDDAASGDDDDDALQGGGGEDGKADGARKGRSCQEPGCEASLQGGLSNHKLRYHSPYMTYGCGYTIDSPNGMLHCPVVTRYRGD